MPSSSSRSAPRLLPLWHFEWGLLTDALLMAAPMALFAIAALRAGASNPLLIGTGAVLAITATMMLAVRLRNRVVFPLHTLSNLLEALREGDYSLRGTTASRNDALGGVAREINALAQTLSAQRLRIEETHALLSKVIESIDIALFSFDSEQKLRLVNAAGLRLLAMNFTDAIGKTASVLQLAEFLNNHGAMVLRRGFPGGGGRFDVRRYHFREGGHPQDLLVITDLSRPLREEERQAWQRLIRVLGHELNNSLASIKSMAETLSSMSAKNPLPAGWHEDISSGLRTIAERADALSRFMLGYATLARLPLPDKRATELAPLLQHVARLEQRCVVALEAGPALQILADPDQLEQALINLIKNAAEAATPSGHVGLRWNAGNGKVVIEVFDDGPGLSATDNLFVPFFTTKPGGSGIGLIVARQIAEAHGGTLTLENRQNHTGCVARLELPLIPPVS